MKFCGMDKNGFIAVIFIFIFASTNCNASVAFHLRKLIAGDHNNSSATSEVSPTGSPVNASNTNPISTGKSQQDKPKKSQIGNQTSSNMTLPIDSKGSKKNDNGTKTVGAPSPPAGEKNNKTVDGGNEKANVTTPKSGNNDDICERSMVRCRDREMLACVEASKEGSKDLFLVVKNEGKTTLKVDVKTPNYLKNVLPPFEVPKHKAKRIDISSTVGKSTELIVNSGNAKCVLPLVQSVSVDNLIRQLTFYSKQVTPIYAVYASFLVALLFGGTWACCRFRKRNQQNGIPYQELEMGLPESTSAVDADVAEGWDHDWDDDWDEDGAIKSSSGHQVRSFSADGLTSRPPKRDGWENDWED